MNKKGVFFTAIFAKVGGTDGTERKKTEADCAEGSGGKSRWQTAESQRAEASKKSPSLPGLAGR